MWSVQNEWSVKLAFAKKSLILECVQHNLHPNPTNPIIHASLQVVEHATDVNLSISLRPFPVQTIFIKQVLLSSATEERDTLLLSACLLNWHRLFCRQEQKKFICCVCSCNRLLCKSVTQQPSGSRLIVFIGLPPSSLYQAPLHTTRNHQP